MSDTTSVDGSISQWGNGLPVRLNKLLAKTAGITDGRPVRITAEQDRIVVEAIVTPVTNLDALLAAFDPARHGGECMAFVPLGKEIG